jgi:hypothetical protein
LARTIQPAQVDGLVKKVERKAKHTMGLFISIGGFTSGTLAAYRERTPLITLGGDDLFFVLDQRVRLDELLLRPSRRWRPRPLTRGMWFPLVSFAVRPSRRDAGWPGTRRRPDSLPLLDRG